MLLGFGAHRAHGRGAAATRLQDLPVGNAAQLLLPLAEPVPRPAGVGVAVDEARHEHPAVGLDDLRAFGHLELGRDGRDRPLRYEHVAVFDDSQFAQSGAPARAVFAGEGEDAGIADQQSHVLPVRGPRGFFPSPGRKERNLCAVPGPSCRFQAGQRAGPRHCLDLLIEGFGAVSFMDPL